MDRNTQYQFISTGTAELERTLVAAYERIAGVTVQPASPEKLFISWVVDIILQERVYCNYVGNQNIPSRAQGENLDRLAELYFLTQRPKPTSAVCTMRFYISEPQESAVLIPLGTRVTDRGSTLYWVTEKDVYIEPGAPYVDVAVRCQTSGNVGNGYAPGQINQLVDLFDYYDSCENITESANGSNTPTDDEFYELLHESQDAWSTAGPMGAYVYLAKKVSSDIADVVANSPEPGVVRLYVLMQEGRIEGEETKKAIVETCSCDELRPMTDLVMSGDPVEVPYNIDLTYYLQRGAAISASDMEALVETAVQEYICWQNGKLGRDINPDKLRNMLLNAGVKRVELRQPVFTELSSGLPCGLGGADEPPEIALIGDVTVQSGGYEDE